MSWKDLFYASLRSSPAPVIAFETGIISGANIWTGARAWTRILREAGLTPGDRVAISVSPSPAYLWIIVACLCEGICPCPIPPGAPDPMAVLEETDAALLIADARGDSPYTMFTPAHEIPETPAPDLRPRQSSATPDIGILLRTSGSTGRPRFAALSSESLLRVIQTHHRYANFSDPQLLSVLPWHHAFGLVLEMLPMLLYGGTVFRDPANGRDAHSVHSLLKDYAITHLNTVPALTADLFEIDPDCLQSVTGIIGGAPADTSLAEKLAGTRLRAGYGQTEAGPGITLGRPGEWEGLYLGRPLGCRVRLSPEGEILFAGRNAFQGYWDGEGLERRTDEWVASGDFAEARGRRLYFRGRKNQSFKLPNGRWFHPAAWEDHLRRGDFPAARILMSGDAAGRIRVFSDDARLLGRLSAPDVEGIFPPARHIGELKHIRAADFRYTPKGDLNRIAMLRELEKSEAG